MFQEHLHNLQQVWKVRQARLKLQPCKSRFLQQQVNILRHIVSAHGVPPDPKKTDRVRS